MLGRLHAGSATAARAPHNGFGNINIKTSVVDASLPPAPGIVTALLETLYERGVIVLRGQSLTPDELDRFARYFGRPQPHTLSHLRIPEHEIILRLSNVVNEERADERGRQRINFWIAAGPELGADALSRRVMPPLA